MRENCLALAVFVFLAVSQCQGDNNTESPLSVALTLEETKCNELIRFGSGISEAAKKETFKIDIKNSADEPIRNLEIYAVIPKGMKYIDSSLAEASSEPQMFDETQNTRIRWIIGSLQANEIRSILIRTYIKCQEKNAQIQLAALGDMSARSVNATNNLAESIDLGVCDCISALTKIIGSPLIINTSLVNEKCSELEQFSPGKMEVARSETFKIDVKNVGDRSINDLTVLAVMPKGMKYINSSYSETEEGRLEAILDPQEFNEEQNTRIAWNIGSLPADKSKSILLNSSLKCPVSRTHIELAAIGNVEDHSVNTTKNEYTDLKICDCIGGNIDINLQVFENSSSIKADFGKGCLESARLVLYNISATNIGDISLSNVKVIAELAPGMMFVKSAYSDPRRGKLNVAQFPKVFDENLKTNLVWDIGDLLPRESKSIIFAAYLNSNVTDKDIFAMVQGYSPYSPEKEPIIDFAETASYVNETRAKFGGPCNEVQKRLGFCTNNEEYPGWIRDFATLLQFQEAANITVISTVYEANNSTIADFGMGNSKPAKLDIFNITLTNNGTVTLDSVEVTAMMAEGMMFNGTAFPDPTRVELNVEDLKTNLTWDVGCLRPNETRSILLGAYLRRDMDINNSNISANVTGNAPNGSLIRAFADRAVLACGNKGCPDWATNLNLTLLMQSQSREEAANITVISAVYEANNSTIADFGIGNNEPAKLDIFNITVANNGAVTIDSVEVTAMMAEGMMFNGTAFSDPTRGKLNVEVDPVDFTKDLKTNLTWNIGCLQPEETKSILFKAFLKGDMDIDKTNISVMVVGSSLNGSLVSASAEKAVPACRLQDKLSQICSDFYIKMGLCKEVCPEWKIQ